MRKEERDKDEDEEMEEDGEDDEEEEASQSDGQSRHACGELSFDSVVHSRCFILLFLCSLR
jgi:hypothetical protein